MRFKERIKSKNIKDFLLFFFLNISNYFYNLKKFYRRLVLFFVDSLLILLSVNIVKYFLYPVSNVLLTGISINKNGGILPNNWLVLILVIVIFVVFNLTGQYISLSRFINYNAIYGIAFRNFLVFSIFLFYKIIIRFYNY